MHLYIVIISTAFFLCFFFSSLLNREVRTYYNGILSVCFFPILNLFKIPIDYNTYKVKKNLEFSLQYALKVIIVNLWIFFIYIFLNTL